MSNSPAPTNYQWIGNTLNFDLDSSVTGVELKYKKDGDADWTIILNSPNTAPTTCNLSSSLGPNGTIWGATTDQTSTGGWSTPVQKAITNI